MSVTIKILWKIRHRKAVRGLYQAVEAYEWVKRWRAQQARWLDAQIAAKVQIGFQAYEPQGKPRLYAQWPIKVLGV